MTDHADTRQTRAPAAAPQGATAPGEQVVRRMLLRRGWAIETEAALLVVEALQALFQASPAEVLQALFHASPAEVLQALQASPAARPPLRPRPRQRPPAAGGCEPMF